MLFFVVFVLKLQGQYHDAETISKDAFWEVHRAMREKRLKGQLDSLYFKYYFQTLDLAPHFKGDPEFILNFYKNTAHAFHYYGILPEETIALYNLFFASFKELKPQLSDSLNQLMTDQMSFALSVQAQSYSQLQQFDMAEAGYRKNIALMKDNKSIYYASALANYGQFLLDVKNDTASAKTYFKKSLAFTLGNFPKHKYLGAIRTHMADLALVEGNTQKAMEIYFTNYHFYCNDDSTGELHKSSDLRKFIHNGTRLIESRLKLGRNENIGHILEHLEYHLKSENAKPELRLKVLFAKVLWLTAQGKPDESQALVLQARKTSDSLTQAEETHQRRLRSAYHSVILKRLRKSHENEKIQKETQIQNQKLRFWVLFVIAVSVIGFMVMIALRRRQNLINVRNEQLLAKQSLKITAFKNKQLEMEVTAKERDLSDFALTLTQNQEWAKQLAARIDTLKGTRGRERKKNLDILESEIRNKVALDADTKTFFHRLDKLSHGFYLQLQEQYPELSKNDIRLSSLIRLKLTSTQIANLQNITVSSVNTSRYRLRKKLDLEKNHDLDKFIQTL